MAKPPTKADQVRTDRAQYVDKLNTITAQRIELDAQEREIKAQIAALDGVLKILDGSGRRTKTPAAGPVIA